MRLSEVFCLRVWHQFGTDFELVKPGGCILAGSPVYGP